MIFPTQTEVDKYMNAISNVKEWALLSKQYILNNWAELMTKPNQIFFVENATFTPNEKQQNKADSKSTGKATNYTYSKS